MANLVLFGDNILLRFRQSSQGARYSHDFKEEGWDSSKGEASTIQSQTFLFVQSLLGHFFISKSLIIGKHGLVPVIYVEFYLILIFVSYFPFLDNIVMAFKVFQVVVH